MESTQHEGLVQESNDESFVDDSEFERLSRLLCLPGDDDLWMPANADAGATAPMPANYADEAGDASANNFPYPDLAPPKYDGRATPVMDKVQYPLMPAAWPGAATAEDGAVHTEICNALVAEENNYETSQLGINPLKESYGSLLEHDMQPHEQDSMEVSNPDKGKDDHPLDEIYGTELTTKTKSLIDRLEDPAKKVVRKERKWIETPSPSPETKVPETSPVRALNQLPSRGYLAQAWTEDAEKKAKTSSHKMSKHTLEGLPDEPPSSPSDSSSSSPSDTSSDPSSDDSDNTEDTGEDTVLVAGIQGDKTS
ncbi:hypothetical protein M407DRAFT_22999 [Tulasnella calospora MUT 4182]|uniref:Uncharacterized protein n=1 Tax=Tulasnella calospora MUT 4182 TaxID=1051891 RepID=A0A0C3QKG4_9AGAM|nr:hypothetical protein M407DRAFT_22999 [Tulasnella calospora MUT 4182]